jgi:tetratricopeptide (TPR) repeat protein
VRSHAGDFDEALATHEAALELTRANRGPEDLRVGVVLGNYGQMLARMGKAGPARENLEAALRIQEEHLGASHPDVAMVHVNLGNTGTRSGDHEYAREHYEEALRIRRASLRTGHPDVGASLLSLGVVHKNLQNLDVAEDYYREAAGIFRRTYGAEHPRLIATHNNLAGVLRAQGKPEAALVEVLEAARQGELVLKPEAPQIANTYKILCEVQLDVPDLPAALTACEKAEAVRRKIHGNKPSGRVAGILETKSEVQLASGARLAAVHSLEEAVAIREAGGKDSDEIHDLRFRLARLLMGIPGRREEAEELGAGVMRGLEQAGKREDARAVAQWLEDPKPLRE